IEHEINSEEPEVEQDESTSLTNSIEDEPKIEDFPEFDEEAALEAVTDEQTLEAQDTPIQEETVQEEVESPSEDELIADSIEDELEIEDFPEFDEDAALDAVT
ncbi:hypothetical protein, partial [Pseudoalteromonas sp. S408]|uniref:hypothetical protein n=1 Tax=Pseudoalteromonas sp. S408 TaxID=2066519 RepID=UPI0012841897